MPTGPKAAPVNGTWMPTTATDLLPKPPKPKPRTMQKTMQTGIAPHASCDSIPQEPVSWSAVLITRTWLTCGWIPGTMTLGTIPGDGMAGAMAGTGVMATMTGISTGAGHPTGVTIPEDTGTTIGEATGIPAGDGGTITTTIIT